jgi:hypothetical protein
MPSRRQVYKEFAEFKQAKDTRTMDEICNSGGEFKLQVQQKFLVEYMRKNPDWKSIMLYHEIGAGKSCSSISMAEEFLRTNPGSRVTVILPARLRTNYFDELISPCGMEAYISPEQFKAYHNPNTPQATKRKIRKEFMTAIELNYDVLSFEQFKNLTKDFDSLKEWADYMTRDRMVIIDEVHNLLNNTYKREVLHQTLAEHKLPKGAKGANTLLFRYMTANAAPGCKMVIMTATPIFDNVGQMRELVGALVPEKDSSGITKLSEAIEALRGRVSYFPGTSPNAYPSVDFMTHQIELSKTQDILTSEVKEKDEEDEDKEAFMALQRQISLACLPHMERVSENSARVISNLQEYAPKILELKKMLEYPGKHVIFSNFIKSGLHIIKAALEKEGWVDFLSGDQAKRPDKAYKVYAFWDGSVKDAQKQLIKSVVNSKENVDGRLIKVILGSPSIKEGVSFKHVQHLHMMDPVWNQSSKAQVEGRAIRFCSHVDIDETRDAPLKRAVKIHIYKSVARKPRGLVSETCDMVIYDTVIPQKFRAVSVAEDALRRVAIDYHLFRRMYKDAVESSPSPTSANIEPESAIRLKQDLALKKKRISKMTNTCPKKRRPVLGVCPDNFESKTNKQGFQCCYKMSMKAAAKKAVAVAGCPAGRSPDVEGKCADGFYIRKNKKGVDCCFKKRVSKKT